MKTASNSAKKFVERASAASGDYLSGAQSTSKDQSAAAIAGKANYAAGINAALAAGRYEKGLQKSGKSGWLKGITDKGANRFAEGVASGASKYAANSGLYDSARSAADSMPRGPKGSEANFARAKAVGQALRKLKTGL
ncbi:MAG: hypothetical protein AAB706_00695 [Patescibacteria group bacterium]